MMKYFNYILILFSLQSCIKVDDTSNQVKNLVVVQALIVAGESPSEIRLQGRNDQGEYLPATGFLLTLDGPLGTVILNESSAGSYENLEAEIFPQAVYVLSGSKQDVSFRAEASTPAIFELMNTVDAVIDVDSNQPFEQLINLDWTDNGEVEYVLVLSPLEASPTEIPFENEGGNFETVFANPQPESGTVLLASDFKYFGAHQLDIYAISKDYSAIFNPILQVNRDDVPYISTNLEGGFGFFSATTKLSITFTLE